MKKSILSAVILAASASVAQADIVGAMLGYTYWNTDNHGDFQTVYGQIEHPVPLLPNLAVGYGKLDHDKLKFDSYDVSGYYEILDNGTITLDMGLGVRHFDSIKHPSFPSYSDTVPMLTFDVELLQDSTLSFYGKLHSGHFMKTNFHDLEVGARYYLFAGLALQGGYRTYKIGLNDYNGFMGPLSKRDSAAELIRGFNLGLHWDI